MSVAYKNNNQTEFIFDEGINPYTVVNNYIFSDSTLSLQAIGLYCNIIRWQNSPSHVITVAGLTKTVRNGKDSIKSALKELVEHGFLSIIQLRDDKGHFKGIMYRVYAKPINVTKAETVDTQCVSPKAENPTPGKPIPDNPPHKNKIPKSKIYKSKIQDDDVNEKEKVTTKEESSSIDKENINTFLTAYSKAMNRDYILRPTQEIAITNLINEYGMDKVLKAISNIEGNPYLMANNDPDKFVMYFTNIYNNKYINWGTKPQPQQKPVIKKTRFNIMNSREWDFEELDRLEDEYIDRKLADSDFEKDIASLGIGGVKLDTVSQQVGTQTVEQVTFAEPESTEQPDYSIDLSGFIPVRVAEEFEMQMLAPARYKEYSKKSEEYKKRKKLGLL